MCIHFSSTQQTSQLNGRTGRHSSIVSGPLVAIQDMAGYRNKSRRAWADLGSEKKSVCGGGGVIFIGCCDI